MQSQLAMAANAVKANAAQAGGQADPRGYKRVCGLLSDPEGPSTQYSRPLLPNTIKSMVFGTRNLKHLVFGPLGDLGGVCSMGFGIWYLVCRGVLAKGPSFRL